MWSPSPYVNLSRSDMRDAAYPDKSRMRPLYCAALLLAGLVLGEILYAASGGTASIRTQIDGWIMFVLWLVLASVTVGIARRRLTWLAALFSIATAGSYWFIGQLVSPFYNVGDPLTIAIWPLVLFINP